MLIISFFVSGHVGILACNSCCVVRHFYAPCTIVLKKFYFFVLFCKLVTASVYKKSYNLLSVQC